MERSKKFIALPIAGNASNRRKPEAARGGKQGDIEPAARALRGMK